MIKAVATLGGQPALIVGLSGENVTRLMAGEPIPVLTAPLGLPPMQVVIMGGRTEGAIAKELTQHAAPARLQEIVIGEVRHVADQVDELIARGRAEAAVAVEEAMRAESERLAEEGNATGVAHGIGIALAMTAVVRAAAGERTGRTDG